MLLNAAKSGMVDKAEEAIAQMSASGLEPGPRAFHVLLFAYVKSKQAPAALVVARRASDAGFKLLPETFVVLIYAFLNQEDGADLETAMSLLESMRAQEVRARTRWLRHSHRTRSLPCSGEGAPPPGRRATGDTGCTCRRTRGRTSSSFLWLLAPPRSLPALPHPRRCAPCRAWRARSRAG